MNVVLLAVLTAGIATDAAAQFNETGTVQPTIPRDLQIDDPFSDNTASENAGGLGDRDGAADKPHPLGLLPNPVIRTDTRYTYEDFIWREVDTSLLHFHEYNPVWKWDYPHLYLGVTGQNYQSLAFDPVPAAGLQPGITGFEKYIYTPSNVRYFNTKIPYTSLYYNLGSATENNARVVHSQNIGPYFNTAVDYRLLNMKGSYVNQKTLLHNLSMNSWYNAKNHRYALLFAFLFNKTEIFENGGLDYEGLYDKDSPDIDRLAVPVNLEDAVNRSNNKGIYLKQYFFLGPERTVKTSDTTEMDIVQRKSAVSYTFHFDYWKYKYLDAQSDSGYYDHFFYPESVWTGDSTMYWTVRHSVRWENIPERWTDSTKVISDLRYYVALNYGYTKYRNMEYFRRWHNLSVSGGINSNLLLDRKWHYGVSGEIHFGPDATGDFLADGFVRWKINEQMHLTARASTGLQTPTQRQQEYRSNHFIWTGNNFDPVFRNKVSLLFRCDHGDIDGELTWHNVRRFIYMDTDREFTQSNTSLNVLIFRAGKAFDWKHFYLYNGIMAQYISDREVLRLPKFYIKQRFFYQGGFFKGLLNAHLGFDITYYTNYYGDSYNPALTEFYRQDTEELKFYPVMDLFFEIKIKRAMLFFMMQHVNQGMFRQKGYYVAPGYNAQDRAFKMGVSWQFYD